MVTRSEPGYTWDFCGGHLAIDFTNTVGSRGGTPEEHFNTYGDVLSWADARGAVTRAEAQRLSGDAERNPRDAREAVASVRALRESLYRVIAATAGGRTIPASDLARLNAHVEPAFARAHLVPHRGRLELAFEATGAHSLSQPIVRPVVRAAIELLTTETIERVRACADDSCAWLFVDTTRNRSRRWCDMKDCGNRNKVRRFRDQG
jgi:predicted RNA-binding Zn ribbon-like protein